jgi:hypothetical protein
MEYSGSARVAWLVPATAAGKLLLNTLENA